MFQCFELTSVFNEHFYFSYQYFESTKNLDLACESTYMWYLNINICLLILQMKRYKKDLVVNCICKCSVQIYFKTDVQIDCGLI